MKPVLSLLAALLGAVLATPALAASTLDEVIKTKVLRVCIPGDYKPFGFAKGAGDFEGIDVDLMQSLAASLGATVKFVPTTWAKLLSDFTAAKCDIGAGGISVTLERQKQAAFSTAYMVNGKAPVARCADLKRFQTVADIDQPGVRVIANVGGSNERFARTHFKLAQLTIHPENVTIFDEILAGRADVFVTESAEAIAQPRLRPGLCGINPDRPLQYGEMAYLLPRNDVAMKAYVDQWLHLLKASGEYQQVVARWL